MAVTIVERTVHSAARSKRVLLTTTGSTTVLQLPTVGGKNRLLEVLGSIAVTGSSSVAVTLSLAWTDPDAGAQTYSWYTSQSLPVGVSPVAPRAVLCQAGSTLTVTAQAATPNLVLVTVEARGA